MRSEGHIVGLCVCRSVALSVCRNVFSRTVAMVGSKRGYVGMCNRRSAQQESGAALSTNSLFMREAKCTVWICRKS